jgi:maltose alpha-D-glucosyltransferase / alpha-amylase
VSRRPRSVGEPRSRRGESGDPLWYKHAIVYELHVRTFYDSGGDGIGDFAGLVACRPCGP